MKKLSVFVFLFLCFVCRAELRCRIAYFTTFGATNISYRAQNILSSVDQLPSVFYNSEFGILFSITTHSSIVSPSPSNSQIGESSLFNKQISTNGNNYVLSPMLFPSLQSMYNGVLNLYLSGYSGPGLIEFYRSNTRIGYNVNFPVLVSDVLSSTNTTYRQLLFSSLSSINSSIQNINVDLGQFQRDYQNVNYGVLNISNYIDSAVSLGLISLYQGELFKGDIASAFREPDTYGDPLNFARSIFDSIHDRDFASNASGYLNDNPQSLNAFAKQFGDSFSAAGAGHFTTPLTNEIQRMNTNWVQETKAALSNNTQKIKDDLQAWKDMLSGPNGSQAAIVSALNGAMNNSGAFKVELQNANNSVYVHLDGPITLDSAQFQDVNNKLQANFDIFHDWVYDIPESWVRYFNMFRDNSSAVLTNQTEQISLLSSLTNLLFEYSLNFTSNTMFAISNSFAGITATNDYMLLSDYADYINTSGLSDLFGVLDDDSYSDLKDELLTLGADDVSAGYGRWWRYYTGLSTIQANSVFNIANLLLDHEKLLKDLKRDNTDVVELSDPSVFSQLLSKIPSLTSIDDKISEITNSIDQSGFVRIRELIPDLTNRLSVVSALYDHDFALPTDISWVLIPANSELNIKERVVHISPSEHYIVFQVLHYGIAFSYCIVNLILLPKFLLLLVRLFDRVWNKSERLIYNSTQS